jgi:hypothetical protein
VNIARGARTFSRLKIQKKMFKLIVAVTSCVVFSVHGAPQLNDAELKEQAFNRINEAEYDYK